MILLSLFFFALAGERAFAALGDPPPTPDGVAATIAAGELARQRGDFPEAARFFRLVADGGAERIGVATPEQTFTARMGLAESYKAMARYQEAMGAAQAALALGKEIQAQTLLPQVMDILGQLSSFLGEDDEALAWFRQGMNHAKAIGDNKAEALIANNLGNFYDSRDRREKALATYGQGIEALAATTGAAELRIKLLLNRAKTLIACNRFADADASLQQAGELIPDQQDNHDKTMNLLSMAALLQESSQQNRSAGNEGRQTRHRLLEDASRIAEKNNDTPCLAHILYQLALVTADGGNEATALAFARQAAFAGQRQFMPEILYRIQWLIGRLLTRIADSDGAITAYQQAVQSLQDLRENLSRDCRRKGKGSFRSIAEPVYQELADLLLIRAAASGDKTKAYRARLEALRVIELLKTAEIEEYYQDECVAALTARTTRLDQPPAGTMVVYPLFLPKRTVLLAGAAGEMLQFDIAARVADFWREADQLREKLADENLLSGFEPHADKLYAWLFKKTGESGQTLEEVLADKKIRTLVFIPDGPLRTIPLGALLDGSRFLIQKDYTIVIAPGMSLTDLRPVPQDGRQVLAAGLTEAVQGFPSLEKVDEELEMMRRQYQAKILRDENFTSQALEETLKTPYSIVHIDSHGEFGASVAKSFILTHDGRMTMDKLGQLARLGELREKPVELLSLCACQTAHGDEQAALGLAGIAVKAGARAALASLWKIDGEATLFFVRTFYQELQQSSKAEAFHRAQQAMLQNKDFAHPFYWAPFLLIGNWL